MVANSYSSEERDIIRWMYANGYRPSVISEQLRILGYNRSAGMISKWLYQHKHEKMPVPSSDIPESLSAEYAANETSPILVFGDCHAPYHHLHALDFLIDTYKSKRCQKHVYCVGDLFDFHAMSRHATETDSRGPVDEYERALEFVSALTALFPKGTLVLGNHDRIPQRQLAESGVIESVLKTDNELYGLPDGWNVEQLFCVVPTLDALIEHGIGSVGVNGAINTAIAKESSYIQGHAHSYAGTFFRSNHRGVRWAMNTGCLVDHGSLAMRYGRHMKHKGILGCGLIWPDNGKQGEHPEFIPMGKDFL